MLFRSWYEDTIAKKHAVLEKLSLVDAILLYIYLVKLWSIKLFDSFSFVFCSLFMHLLSSLSLNAIYQY